MSFSFMPSNTGVANFKPRNFAAQPSHLRQERPQVQDVEWLAGGHFLPWPEEPFFDVAPYPAANIHHVSGVRLPRVLDEDIGVTRRYLGDFHRGWRRLRRDFL